MCCKLYFEVRDVIKSGLIFVIMFFIVRCVVVVMFGVFGRVFCVIIVVGVRNIFEVTMFGNKYMRDVL